MFCCLTMLPLSVFCSLQEDCNDCAVHTFCAPCAVCQESRELNVQDAKKAAVTASITKAPTTQKMDGK
jgi:hypothetical protein